MTDIVERRSKDNCVICPDCNHEFVAVPVDVQEELASLRRQLDELEDDEQKAVERCVIAEQKLAECQAQNTKLSERVVGVGEIAINSVSRDRLAECQAREMVLRDALKESYDEDGLCVDPDDFVKQDDSTALDTMLKEVKREALLEAAKWLETHMIHGYLTDMRSIQELERMAKELE